MNKQKVNIQYHGKLIVADVTVANNFWTGLSGYMFRKSHYVPGILFESSGGIQTTFMNFGLDVIFSSIAFRYSVMLRAPKIPGKYSCSIQKNLETARQFSLAQSFRTGSSARISTIPPPPSIDIDSIGAYLISSVSNGELSVA